MRYTDERDECWYIRTILEITFNFGGDLDGNCEAADRAEVMTITSLIESKLQQSELHQSESECHLVWSLQQHHICF